MRHVGLLVIHWTTSGLGCSANLDHQLGDALDVLHGPLGIDTALKAVARIGGEIEATRTACDRLRPPESSLHIYVASIVRNSRGVAAHDASQRLNLGRIGDHAHRAIHRHGVAIQELELLARLAPAHIQAAVDLVQIKNVRRPPQLEHDVVGNVHQWGHAALAATCQTIHHPLRSFGRGIDVANHTTRKTAAQICCRNFYWQNAVIGDVDMRKRGCIQGRTGQSGQLTGHTIYAQAVGQIGRKLQCEQRVIQVQVVPHIGAQRCVSGQFHQATTFLRNLQLLGRAQHALALYTAQLAHFDDKGLAIFTRRQFGSDHCAGDANTYTRIGRTADNVQQFRLAHIDLAYTQTVSIGVLLRLFDFADHDASEGGSDRLQLFHFEPRHGERVGQLLGGQRWVAKTTQPGFWKLHGE